MGGGAWSGAWGLRGLGSPGLLERLRILYDAGKRYDLVYFLKDEPCLVEHGGQGEP